MGEIQEFFHMLFEGKVGKSDPQRNGKQKHFYLTKIKNKRGNHGTFVSFWLFILS